MNNKGFTLIEILISLLLLGLVTVFAFITVTALFSLYKKNIQKVFVSKVGSAISQYIGLSINDINFTQMSDTYIVKTAANGSHYCTDYVSKSERLPFSLIEEYIDKKLVNPNDKITCDVTNTDISYFVVYKDSDYVTYYEINLDCVTTLDNSGADTYDLSTLPKLSSTCSW